MGLEKEGVVGMSGVLRFILERIYFNRYLVRLRALLVWQALIMATFIKYVAGI